MGINIMEVFEWRKRTPKGLVKNKSYSIWAKHIVNGFRKSIATDLDHGEIEIQ